MITTQSPSVGGGLSYPEHHMPSAQACRLLQLWLDFSRAIMSHDPNPKPEVHSSSVSLSSSAPTFGSPEVMRGFSHPLSLLKSVFHSVPNLLRVQEHLPDTHLADFSWPDHFANSIRETTSPERRGPRQRLEGQTMQLSAWC